MKLGLLITFAAVSLSAQSARKAVFISPDELDIAAILPDPPANDSAEMKRELVELHRLQDTRSAGETARAKADDAEEDIFVFRNVLGEGFSAQNLPATALLSMHLHNDEGQISNPAKNQFKRARPYQFDAGVKPVCAIKTTPDSYPSGHSTTGYLEAFALAMMVPEKRELILARADDYAHNRLVCGVHYASDTVASKAVAYAMFAIIMQKPQFKQEFDAAQQETRRALGLAANSR